MYGYHAMISFLIGTMVFLATPMLGLMFANGEGKYISHTPTWKDKPIEK